MPNIVEFPGIYRRRVVIRGGDGICSVDMEDDPHRFGVDIDHAHGAVKSITGRALRTPWTACPAAVMLLEQFRGTPLLASPYAVLRQVRLREHCTHIVDAAGLAIAAAARGVGFRKYDIAARVRQVDGHAECQVTLRRDGVMIEQCTISEGRFPPGHDLAGMELRRAASWAADVIDDPDRLEALLVLQRAVLVSASRRTRGRGMQVATDAPHMRDTCFTFSAERAPEALWVAGSMRDFTENPAGLLADLPQGEAPGEA